MFGTIQSQTILASSVNVLMQFILSYYLLHLSQLRARNPFARMLVAISRSHAISMTVPLLLGQRTEQGKWLVIIAGWLVGSLYRFPCIAAGQ